MNVEVAGYTFTPMKGFDGYEIDNVPGSLVAEFAAACSYVAECVGFDSNGWLKFGAPPADWWYKWTDNPCLGFYTKNVSEN